MNWLFTLSGRKVIISNVLVYFSLSLSLCKHQCSAVDERECCFCQLCCLCILSVHCILFMYLLGLLCNGIAQYLY